VTVPTPNGPVTLAVPTTFMNESGAALPPLLRRTSLEDLSRLVIAPTNWTSSRAASN